MLVHQIFIKEEVKYIMESLVPVVNYIMALLNSKLMVLNSVSQKMKYSAIKLLMALPKMFFLMIPHGYHLMSKTLYGL